MVFADSFYDLGWLEQKNVAAAPGHSFQGSGESGIDAFDSLIEPSPIPAPATALNKSAKPPETAPGEIAGHGRGNGSHDHHASPARFPSFGEERKDAGTGHDEFAERRDAGGLECAAFRDARSASARHGNHHGARHQPGELHGDDGAKSRDGAGNFQRRCAAKPGDLAGKFACEQGRPCDDQRHHSRHRARARHHSGAERDRKHRRLQFRFSFAGLLSAATLILLWVIFSEFRRRMSVSVYRSPAPATGPSFDALEPETAIEKMAAPKRIAGGPPQVSLHLKASEPSVRRAAVPFGKTSRPFMGNGGGVTTVGAAVENLIPRAPAPHAGAGTS